MDWLSDTVEGPGFFPSLYSAIWFLSLGLYLRGCKMAAAVPAITCRHNNIDPRKRQEGHSLTFLRVRKFFFQKPTSDFPSSLIGHNYVLLLGPNHH